MNKQPEGANLTFMQRKAVEPQQKSTATGEVYLKPCIKLRAILQLKTVLTGLKECSVLYRKHLMIFKKL